MLQSVFSNARERLEKEGILPSPTASESEEEKDSGDEGDDEDSK